MTDEYATGDIDDCGNGHLPDAKAFTNKPRMVSLFPATNYISDAEADEVLRFMWTEAGWISHDKWPHLHQLLYRLEAARKAVASKP